VKIGTKILIYATILCIVLYAGIFIGRQSAGNMTYLPHVLEDVGSAQLRPVNLNTATVDELTQIPDIGPVLATAIVEYREEYGKYLDIKELLDIPGITNELYDRIKPYVKVG